MISANIHLSKKLNSSKQQTVPVYLANYFSEKQPGATNLAKLSASLLAKENALLITAKKNFVRPGFQYFVNPPDILLIEERTDYFPPHPHNNGRLLVTEYHNPEQIRLFEIQNIITGLNQNHIKIEWVVVTNKFSADLICWHLKL